MPLFESYDRRIKQINEALAKYGIGSIEEAEQLCLSKGINPREIVNGIQPIAFENAIKQVEHPFLILLKLQRCSIRRCCASILTTICRPSSMP